MEAFCLHFIYIVIKAWKMRQTRNLARNLAWISKWRCNKRKLFHLIFSGPVRLWNQLPLVIREDNSVQTLRSKIKPYLFSLSHCWCQHCPARQQHNLYCFPSLDSRNQLLPTQSELHPDCPHSLSAACMSICSATLSLKQSLPASACKLYCSLGMFLWTHSVLQGNCCVLFQGS